MRDDDTNERGDPNSGDPGAADRARGFNLRLGLGLVSGLLDDLRNANARHSTLPRRRPGHRWSIGERPGRSRAGGATRSNESQRDGRQRRPADSLVDTRVEDDEFIVTADIPDATRDDLSVGINPRTNTLVIGRDGSVLRRVDIPWLSPEATRVWFHNGVLEVRLQPSDA